MMPEDGWPHLHHCPVLQKHRWRPADVEAAFDWAQGLELEGIDPDAPDGVAMQWPPLSAKDIRACVLHDMSPFRLRDLLQQTGAKALRTIFCRDQFVNAYENLAYADHKDRRVHDYSNFTIYDYRCKDAITRDTYIGMVADCENFQAELDHDVLDILVNRFEDETDGPLYALGYEGTPLGLSEVAHRFLMLRNKERVDAVTLYAVGSFGGRFESPRVQRIVDDAVARFDREARRWGTFRLDCWRDGGSLSGRWEGINMVGRDHSPYKEPIE